MAFTVEVEEWVGSVWHRFITRRASPDFPEASVELESMQRSLSVLFRAMGGASGVGVEAANARDLMLRRNLLQQVAGTCKQLPVAWCDASNLRLPQRLAVYPEISLNQDLYRWLALLAAQAGEMRHWARDNQRWTQSILQRFPAMRPRYERLVEAHLQLRPDPASLPRAEGQLELALCQALREPGSVTQFPRSEVAPWPLPMWLYPAENLGVPQAGGITTVGDDNWIMAYTHIAHDCHVGNHTTLANNTTLAGHVRLGDWVTVGGLTGIHQFVKVGAHAMVGFASAVSQDVPPFMLVDGNPLAVRGYNVVGLRRRGFSPERIAAVKQMHKLIYRQGLTLEAARAAIAELVHSAPQASEDAAMMERFLADATRGIAR